MDAYTTKINKIKQTIDEIRGDINIMKIKNESAINGMISSIKNIDISSYKEDTGNGKNFYSDSNFNKSEHIYIEPTNSSKIIYPETSYKTAKTIKLHEETCYKTIHNECEYKINRLEKQTSEMQATINELHNSNLQLQQEILDERRTRTDKGNLIDEIKDVLKVTDDRQIIPNLIENVRSVKDSSNNFKLVEKLKELYLDRNGNPSKEYIDNRTIWRWVKDLVRSDSILKSSPNEPDPYKEYCAELMREYNIKEFGEFKLFIQAVLNKNNSNKKRVEKIKHLLMMEPVSTIKHLQADN